MHITTLLSLALLSCVSASNINRYPGWASPYSLDPLYPRDVASYCPSQPASEALQRQILYVLFSTPTAAATNFFTSDSFVTALYVTKDVTAAFNKYVAVDLIEHDPFDPQGRDANAAKLSSFFPFVTFDVLRQSFGTLSMS